MRKSSAIVVGAGIMGLAIARMLAIRGFKVTVFERNPQAVGASVRNFGMVWPIGQPDGLLYERARRSRNIWREVCREANIWYDNVGSLHVATHPLEAEAMQQISAAYANSRSVSWLEPQRALKKSHFINPENVLGALWSPHEMIVEAREAIPAISALLKEKYQVEFHYTRAINRVEGRSVWSGQQNWQADIIFVCSGADFETLFPDLYYSLDINKCKLQMMRLEAPPDKIRIGPALCGGLSLIHYKGFEVSPLIKKLRKLYEDEMPEYIKWGIHVMACQNPHGELTVGDTHEYGWNLDPFDKEYLNRLVLDYLAKFSILAQYPLVQSWHGIYAKMNTGESEYVGRVEEQVYVVNGLGGSGMTQSFGLAEELVKKL